MLARSLFRAASSARKSPSLAAATANFGATLSANFSDAPTVKIALKGVNFRLNL